MQILLCCLKMRSLYCQHYSYQ
ncbi:hypothetical protein Patl1_12365 [Pistacia atlantica]|uniref:Uncharacterized protein n=1 Tax=Pistacia atlantica TaxID=434234 RepID=A0ACC1A6T3_9ROSI|nr:hypothetical protein Patl1_12365 [Pistacia atlantica]